MSLDTQTPEEIAREAHSAISNEMERAKVRAVAHVVSAFCSDDQPLAAYHLMRQSGADKGRALVVLDAVERAGEVINLLSIEELSERADT